MYVSQEKYGVRGFTIIELILIIGFTAIVGVIGITNFSNFKNSQDVSGSASGLVNYLRNIQQKATSQDQSAKWGVHLDAVAGDQDKYTIFYGDSFAAGTVSEVIYLPKTVQFTDPAQGTIKDIIFSKVTGAPESGAASISLALLSNPASPKVITISAIGLIELVGS